MKNAIVRLGAAAAVSAILLTSVGCSSDGKDAGKGYFDEILIQDKTDFQRQDPNVAEAWLETIGGVPRLFVDGVFTAPLFFWGNTSFTFGTEEQMAAQIQKARDAGIDMFATEVTFSTMVDDGRYDFGSVDSKLDFILEQNPEAKIIIRASPSSGSPSFWEDLYPGETKRLENGELGSVPSYASEHFKTYALNGAKALVEHVLANPKYSNAVIGYHYGYSEWFQGATDSVDFSDAMLACYRAFLKQKYATDQALQQAWDDPSVTLDTVEIASPPGNSSGSMVDYTVMTEPKDQRFVDYYECINQNSAQIIGEIAKTIKDASGGRSLFFTFYGYTFEVAGPKSCHNGMATLLQDPNVDVICSPLTYQNRMEGGTGGYMSLADSLAQHNKLWIMENDLRTKSNDETPYDEPDAGYNPQTVSIESALEIQRREFGLTLSRNAGMYWMDLWGAGWLEDDAFWTEFKQMIQLYKDYARSFDRFCPEVAIVVDESSIYRMADTAALPQDMLYKQRMAIYSSGVTFGLYETSDAASGYIDAKLYIFLDPWDIDEEEMAAIQKNIIDKDRTVLWMNGFGAMDSSRIQTLTGMNILSKSEPYARKTTVLTQGDTVIQQWLRDGFNVFGTDSNNPYFYVEDPQATTLGTYQDSGEVSFALKETDGYKSLFYAGTSLTPELIRAVAAYAGANVFMKQNDTLTGNQNFLCVHAAAGGEKTLHFAVKQDVYDYYADTWYTSVDTVTVNMEFGETRFFFYGDKKEIEKYNLVRK